MTTSKFIVKERVNNEWKAITTWNDKENALRAVATSLMNDENADPQNFKIEEVNEVDTIGTLYEVANTIGALYEVANTIENRFASFSIKFETAHLGDKEDGFLVMEETDTKYPSLNNVELGIIFEVVNGINDELPEGYEVIFVIDHACRIRLMMSKPKPENK